MCYLEWHRVQVQVWITLEVGDSCRGEVPFSIMGGEGWPAAGGEGKENIKEGGSWEVKGEEMWITLGGERLGTEEGG